MNAEAPVLGELRREVVNKDLFVFSFFAVLFFLRWREWRRGILEEEV